MKSAKRFLSFFLALALCLSMTDAALILQAVVGLRENTGNYTAADAARVLRGEA